MVAVSIRRRGNSWQVRVGSGKAQHSVGSFKSYESAVQAAESERLKTVDSVESNYSRQLADLASQIAAESVRERKEWIESFLIENSGSTADLLKNAGKAAEMAAMVYDSSTVSESALDLDSFKKETVSTTEICMNPISKMTESERNTLYESYYEFAVGNTVDFDKWLSGLSETDLDKLDHWIVRNWNVSA